MSEFEGLDFVYLLLALVLPVSALIGRKLEWRKGAIMGLAWVGIFAFVLLMINLVLE